MRKIILSPPHHLPTSFCRVETAFLTLDVVAIPLKSVAIDSVSEVLWTNTLFKSSCKEDQGS